MNTHLATTDNSLRDQIAQRIQKLSQRWAENSIDLGREFKLARETFPQIGSGHSRPGWEKWIKEETGWSKDHVTRFIGIAERFGNRALPPGMQFSVLEYLKRGHVPEAAIDDVIGHIEQGKKVNQRNIKDLVKPHLPTPAQAIKEARETGKLVSARDGNMYSGASEDEIAAYSQRRDAVYTIRRAVKMIAECDLTPAAWVNGAEDFWITEFPLKDVDTAIKWLEQIRPRLEKRQREISND